MKRSTVEKTVIVFESTPQDINVPLPSVNLSEWTVLGKSTFSSREYKLVLRDQSGNLIDSYNAPDLIIDGPAKLISLSKISKGSWKVSFEYLYDTAIVKVGLRIGTHRIDYFRQLHFQLHEIDFMQSKTFTQKSLVRADGEDKLKIHVSLRDGRGYNIFSTNDYKMDLIIDKSDVKVEGPFSAAGGPYFQLSSKTPGAIRYSVKIDGETLPGEGVAQFVTFDRRSPAAENKSCLADLAKFAGMPIPDEGPLASYQILVSRILAIYEEKRDSTSENFQELLNVFSSPSCTANRLWDGAREEAGRDLRVIHRRFSR